jgi:hypothetical protein
MDIRLPALGESGEKRIRGMLWNSQYRVSQSQQIGSSYQAEQRRTTHCGDYSRKPQSR